MYNSFRFLKTIGMIITLLIIMTLALIGSEKLMACMKDIGAVSKQTVNLPIIDEDYTRTHLGAESTVFVVDYYGVKYTLPFVPTNRVRTYHAGDAIPVKVIEYESGVIRLSVDIDAIGA